MTQQTQNERIKTMKQRMTIKQYMASLRRLVPGVQYQVDAWPYPQAEQSHIAIWLDGTDAEPGKLPNSRIRIYLVNSDCPGVLMRIRSDQPTPKQTAQKLINWLSTI